MKDSTSVLEANLDYAVRMVRAGCGTPEQAARICGVCLPDLQARLAVPFVPGADAQWKPMRFEP